MANPGNKFVRSTDSKSLWNYTTSPGFDHEEAEVLRLALMKWGFGSWSTIFKEGVLPGKTFNQLNNQAQRMVGQQSVAEFMGLKLDCRDVLEKNLLIQGKRKNGGCLINDGANPTRETVRLKLQENKEKFELSQEEIDKRCKNEDLYKLKLREDKNQESKQFGEELQRSPSKMTREEKIEVFKKLREKWNAFNSRLAEVQVKPKKTDAPVKDKSSRKRSAPSKNSPHNVTSLSKIYRDAPDAPEEGDDVIRCICGATEEDGEDMVQCDHCQVWMHLTCLNLTEEDVHDKFYCRFCEPIITVARPKESDAELAMRLQMEIDAGGDSDDDFRKVCLSLSGSGLCWKHLGALARSSLNRATYRLSRNKRKPHTRTPSRSH